MTRINEIRATAEGEQHRRFFVEPSWDWPDLNPWHKFNWRNFALIHIGGEIEHYTGRVEFEVALLGLHLRVTYVYDDTFAKKMLSKKEEIMGMLQAEHPGMKIEDPFGALDDL